MILHFRWVSAGVILPMAGVILITDGVTLIMAGIPITGVTLTGAIILTVIAAIILIMGKGTDIIIHITGTGRVLFQTHPIPVTAVEMFPILLPQRGLKAELVLRQTAVHGLLLPGHPPHRLVPAPVMEIPALRVQAHSLLPESAVLIL